MIPDFLARFIGFVVLSTAFGVMYGPKRWPIGWRAACSMTAGVLLYMAYVARWI